MAHMSKAHRRTMDGCSVFRIRGMKGTTEEITSMYFEAIREVADVRF